jgi:threonylcarbamoyladenosine tRNA methylthiotransferase MtaB
MKVFLESIGCRLNLSEIEKISEKLRTAGHEIVGDSSEADIAVVNTCAVTNSASADSRKSVRRIAKSGCDHIHVTGCYATVDPEALLNLPSVEKIYNNNEKTLILDGLTNKNNTKFDAKPGRKPLPGKSHRTRAFIKVQDGCNNHCTFCLTRIARGKSISLPESEIFNDVKMALLGGAKEIVLTGVNLGSWGRDLDEKKSLPKLLNKIIDRYGPKRIRLSSIEPWDVDESYFPVFEKHSFCKHLHLPLQSGSDVVLANMGRKITTIKYQKLVTKIRNSFPEMAITTDLIVGFPGESERDFRDGLDFVKEIDFSGGHVFRYSPRVGTPAEKMENAVLESEKRNRSRKMRSVISESEIRYQGKFIDRQVSVLWERVAKLDDGKFLMVGLTGNYLRVSALANEDLQNTISNVQLLKINGNLLSGNIIFI